jgi:hypothetical protein
MAQAITTACTICPLYGEEISLDVSDWRVPTEWRDVVAYRELWARVSDVFRACRSIDSAASQLSVSREVVVRVLDFLCKELCGCRAVTCVSCLDDYRSEL